MKTIIFYAPLARNLPQHLIGGGEIGCRRTYEIIRNAGYNIETVDKPTMARGRISFVRIALIGYCRYISLLLRHKDAIAYIVGFYEKNVYLEWLLLITATILRHKKVYEIRNGRLIKTYKKFGSGYKDFLDSILKKADVIFCQGLDYVDFIRQKYNRDSIYTPNYVMNKYLEEYHEREIGQINLIYTGRVTEQKNINVIINIFYELLKRGHKTKLVIIGAYTEDYKQLLDEQISSFGFSQNIIFTGMQDFHFITREMKKSHFFVFPSAEKKEGHSNSLTEAMAFGVVPIASDAGFNSTVIGKQELIIHGFNAKEYADCIEQIWDSGNWRNYSQFIYSRVINNFTEEIVGGSILTGLDSI